MRDARCKAKVLVAGPRREARGRKDRGRWPLAGGLGEGLGEGSGEGSGGGSGEGVGQASAKA